MSAGEDKRLGGHERGEKAIGQKAAEHIQMKTEWITGVWNV